MLGVILRLPFLFLGLTARTILAPFSIILGFLFMLIGIIWTFFISIKYIITGNTQKVAQYFKAPIELFSGQFVYLVHQYKELWDWGLANQNGEPTLKDVLFDILLGALLVPIIILLYFFVYR